jgi:hypothetical protein
MNEERRRHPRIPISLPFSLRVLSLGSDKSAALTGEQVKMQNLSSGGACVLLPQRIAASDVVEMQISVPERESPIKVYAELVWAEDTADRKQRIGMRFMAIRDADAAVIEKLNANAQPSMSGARG